MRAAGNIVALCLIAWWLSAARADKVVAVIDFPATPAVEVSHRARYVDWRLSPGASEALAPAQALFWGIPVALAAVDADLLAAGAGLPRSLADRILARAAEPDVDWSAIDALSGVGPSTLARLQSRFTLQQEVRP